MNKKSKTKKILVFGSSGMLGHIICFFLMKLNKFEVFTTSKQFKTFNNTRFLDVRDLNKVKKFLYEISPDIVINCAGLLISESKSHLEDAIVINSVFPNVLSRLGNELDFKLIHISTDCVFSGKRGDYTEEDFCDGDTVYARTKILGEILHERHLTIRTSIIGPELNPNGSGLLNWFLHQNGEISGFKNVHWTGMTTLELAICIEKLIKQDLTGLYNLVPEEKISKYKLLCLFKEVWKKNNIRINPVNYPSFDKSLCSKNIDYKCIKKNYKDMLFELYDWIETNKVLYPHYFNKP